MTPMSLGWKSTRRLTLCLGAAWLVAGCNASVGNEGTPPASTSTPALAAPVPAAPAPVTSVNDLMVSWIDNSGHVLWNVERQGRAPKNDADWLELKEHATQLAAAGTLIQLGGTGQPDPGWAKSPDWKMNAQKMSAAAVDAISAAKGKDLQSLVKANGRLAEACENCHKEFKPDLPTEGIKHHPPHER